MIGAHQDDNEFRCGGITSKYKKLGHDVRFLCFTKGNAGHHILSDEEAVAVRAKESAAVAEFLGIKYDVWDYADCTVVADLETRNRLIRYIREYSPDVIITHRTIDYHPDHRAVALVVQDATYPLVVPHVCPEAPAMRQMPVVMYYEDRFKNPEFECDVVVDVDDEIDVKLKIADLNVSQVYEWLPYTHGEENEVPEGKEERFEWLKGMNITSETTDEEVMAASRGYSVRYAKVAARFRKELIKKYGEEKGSKVRYAEAFQVSEYGTQLTKELKDKLFPF